MNNQLEIIRQSLTQIQPQFEENISKLGLKSIEFNQEFNFAIQAMQTNPFLMKMDQASIIKAVLNTSLTGLSLNPVLKYAYLVPRKGQCCLDPSYMGLIKILTDTGSVKNIEAGVVYWGETFEMIRGTDPVLRHGTIQDPKTPKGDIRGAYSVATLNDGSKSIEFMDSAELMSIMQRSESVKSGKGGPWSTDTAEMCKKTVIKRHYKYLPKSERGIIASNAIYTDHETNGIDFEAERTKQSATISVDTINPEDTNIMKSLEEMLAAIPNPRVPENLFEPQTKQQFIESFRNELVTGMMPQAKAKNVYDKILSYFQ